MWQMIMAINTDAVFSLEKALTTSITYLWEDQGKEIVLHTF